MGDAAKSPDNAKNEMKTIRRIAANRVVVGDKQMVCAVVEIRGDKVERIYPLTEEQAFTEWLGGTIDIKQDCGEAFAYKDGTKLTSF